MHNDIHQKTIDNIKSIYAHTKEDWILAYSGGKDSSALLNIVSAALTRIKKLHRQIVTVYCDSGVEIPYINQHARGFLKKLREKNLQLG